MDTNKYNKLVSKYTPKEDVSKNVFKAFIGGGIMGLLGQGLIDIYSCLFNITNKEAGIYMIITLIFLGCLFTCLGWFDRLVNFFRCGLIIPITGFAHAMQSATLEYRREGLITGIGTCMFKLAGSVIAYGIISAYTFGVIRLIILGVLK